MSKIEVNEIDAQCGSTITVGSAGKTVTVPGNVVKTNTVQASDGGNIVSQCGTTNTIGAAGDTVTVAGNIVKSNTLQASDGGNIVNQCGTTITLGASGDTITLAAGASQSGFGRAGSVDWQTGDIKTATFTASDGEGYFCNTTSSAFTVNLPAGSAGAIVAINDYANTAATNNITIAANGSEKIQGSTTDHVISTNGVTITLVYVDGTQGWKLVDTGEASSLPEQALFTVATGGTITCCGDYKIHTFTGPGTFCVSQIGNGPTNPTGGPNTVSYMVVAGGGGVGPAHWAGGAGAGGFREGRDIAPSYTASPLAASSGLTIAASPYPVTVGGGGSGSNGSNSIFLTITSAGGGYGGNPGPTGLPQPGGSGAGNNPYCKPVSPVGAGNQPPVSPPQGNPGGTGLDGPTGLTGRAASGGGGGAGGTGGNAANITPTYPGSCSAGRGGAGGNGVATSITGSSVTRAGGGAGSTYLTGEGGVGGSGGGGNGGIYNPIPGYSGPPFTSSPGAVNTGGGAGSCHNFCGNTGGSGIVVIRYKYQ